MGRLLIALSFLVVAGCVNGPDHSNDRVEQKPRVPTVYFAETGAADLANRIANHCINRGFILLAKSGGTVQCSKQLTTGEAMAATFMIGNQYSTRPVRVAHFTLIAIKNDIRVQAQQWVETTTAFGQKRSVGWADNDPRTSMRLFLQELGGVPET